MNVLLLNIFMMIIIYGINYFTSVFEAEADGWDLIGFPFRFYKYTAGKGIPFDEAKQFIIKNLVLDVIIYYFLVMFINYIIFRNKKSKINQSTQSLDL